MNLLFLKTPFPSPLSNCSFLPSLPTFSLHDLMKPRHLLGQDKTCTDLPLDLISHDGRLYLECAGRQLDASHLGHPAGELLGLLSRPFRPARKPRVVFLGLGLGHALAAARHLLPQEKASFVILPESPVLPGWLSEHLPADPLDDPRVLLAELSPFVFLDREFQDSQAIYADLDHLEALAPKSWAVSDPGVLGNYHERLKHGGLLGFLAARPRPALEKALRRAGFEVATELAPLSPTSKKQRTLYLARKGQYQWAR